MPLLETLGLEIGYPGRPPLFRGLGLQLQRGELAAVIGPNGCGKSTLLRTLSGLQTPLGGRVLLCGNDLEELSVQQRALHLGLVLSRNPDTEFLDVESLVLLGRYPHRPFWSGLTPTDRKVADEALASMEATHLKGRYVQQLSDGEKQRVLMARALTQDPQILMLDEPTSFLDLPHKIDCFRLLRRWAHDRGRAVLLSTHDLDLAIQCVDTLWLMDAKNGFVRGVPEVLMMDGSLPRAFEHPGVRLNVETGRFEMRDGGEKSIALEGVGVECTWTARALVRLGYRLEAAVADRPKVILQSHEGGCVWRYESSGLSREYSCLGDLLAHLKNLSADA